MKTLKQINNFSLFRLVFLGLILAELLSIFAWKLPVFNTACFFVLVFFCFILSFKDLKYGIYIAVAELMIGSHGYLFALNLGEGETLLSIRMGIFGAVMLAWVVNVLRQDGFLTYWQKLKMFKFFKYYLYLAIILVWGFAWGLIRGNDFGNAFLDFNNWLFFLYILPLVEVFCLNQEAKASQASDTRSLACLGIWGEFSVVILAALIWLIIKTLTLVYIFSHQFVWALPELYQWIRDTRVGEITMMSNNFYRIFLQSQVYTLLAFFVLLPISKFKNFKYFILITGCLMTVIISFSRSFWLGLAGGLGVYFLYLIYSSWKVLKLKVVKLLVNDLLKFILIGAVSVGIIFLIINLPPKLSGEGLGSLLAARTTQIEAAGSSRINMLKPLLSGIMEHPVVGSGFGTTVTYRSVDPRVLTTTAGASGEYTTYAFEWSYLGWFLKAGLVGLIVYGLLIFKILQVLWQPVKKIQLTPTQRRSQPRYNNQKISNFQFLNQKQSSNATIEQSHNRTMVNSINVGLSLALLSLLIVNIFTPYLNHPLGIGFILFASVFAGKEYK